VYHHCGRTGAGLFDLMIAAGDVLPMAVVTEGGPDNLSDVTEYLKSLRVADPFSEIKGWQSLKVEWAEWGRKRGWTPEQYYIRGLEAIRHKIYAKWPNIRAYLTYIYGNNGDPLWLSHDDNWEPLLVQYETVKISSEIPIMVILNPVPKPMNAGVGVRVRMSTGYKLRTGNGTQYTEIRVVPINEFVTRYENTALPSSTGDAFTWEYIETTNGSGWMASQGQFIHAELDLQLGMPVAFIYNLTGKFNDARSYGKHEGLDFAPVSQQPGGLILAAHDGIARVGTDAEGYGSYVKVISPEGYITWYGHLSERLVAGGVAVKKYQPIGRVGSSGNSTGVHLHFTLAWPGKGLSGYVVADVIDPTPYFVAPPVAVVVDNSTELAAATAEIIRLISVNQTLDAESDTLVAKLEAREATMKVVADGLRLHDGAIEQFFTALEAHTETM